MFIGRLARLADPIVAPVTAHLPGPVLLHSRTQRRASRSRAQVLAARSQSRLG
jgi:hypothetical protein